MHFSQLVSTLLLGSSVAGVYGFVMPDPMIEGKKAAHSYHLLDLDTSEMKVLGNATDEADSLEKRTKVCLLTVSFFVPMGCSRLTHSR